ncbi:hypothetical protein ACMA1I_18380 [Pontibacter sp. 13R65]|uniref:hypothetical protein n=1 Tax=Pontibacter sp. 13R65 TaxID=3127458 RepID=UPI00301BEC15
MKSLWRIVLILTVYVSIIHSLSAQNNEWHKDRKTTLLFGLTQPLLLKGFNVEANYIHNRLIFDYSHGASLEFGGNLLPDYLEGQGVVVYLPFSTGFGVGYRFTQWLNLRVEPKWHRFEFYYANDVQNANNIIAVDANNYSIGLGLYGNYQPFKRKDSFLTGITIAPSIRFWPTIASGFEGNSFRYDNKRTGKMEELKTLGSGIGFSPLVLNVSIGYTFNLKKS